MRTTVFKDHRVRRLEPLFYGVTLIFCFLVPALVSLDGLWPRIFMPNTLFPSQVAFVHGLYHIAENKLKS